VFTPVSPECEHTKFTVTHLELQTSVTVCTFGGHFVETSRIGIFFSTNLISIVIFTVVIFVLWF